MVRGAPAAACATMVAMESTTAPDRSNAPDQRPAQVKLVGLPLELPPPSETDTTLPARLLASFRDTVSRVIGCLEAARP